MNNLKEGEEKSLREKIELSEIFTVIINRGYLQKLMDYDPKFLRQIAIAEELNKPFVVIIDSNLSYNEKQIARSLFKNYNVVKEEEIDLSNVRFLNDLYQELDLIARQYAIKAGKNIEEGIKILRE